MPIDEALLELLFEHMLAIERADTPGQVLDRVLAASEAVAPRAALFLVRRGRLRGFRAVGESADALRRIGSVDLPMNEGWAARYLCDACPTLLGDDVGEPSFGQAPAMARCVVSLTLEGKPMAALIIGRNGDEQPWSPPGLSILALYAQARLELELHRRRRALARAAVPQRAVAALDATPSAAVPRIPEPLADMPEAADDVALAPVEPDPRPKDPQSMRLDEARRFARLIATDIRLYNEEAVLLGRRQRDLASRLEAQMERGRESFQRRFADLGHAGARLLSDAYVEVLAAGDAALLGGRKPSPSAIGDAG